MEKQRLLKDRVLLIGKNLVEEREKILLQLNETRKNVILLEADYASLNFLAQIKKYLSYFLLIIQEIETRKFFLNDQVLLDRKILIQVRL